MLLPIEVLHCGNSDFGPSLLPDIDSMTYIYQLDPYFLLMIDTKCVKMNFIYLSLQMLLSDRQTALKLCITPLHRWSVN